jgi:hypothetical protein
MGGFLLSGTPQPFRTTAMKIAWILYVIMCGDAGCLVLNSETAYDTQDDCRAAHILSMEDAILKYHERLEFDDDGKIFADCVIQMMPAKGRSI